MPRIGRTDGVGEGLAGWVVGRPRVIGAGRPPLAGAAVAAGRGAPMRIGVVCAAGDVGVGVGVGRGIMIRVASGRPATVGVGVGVGVAVGEGVGVGAGRGSRMRRTGAVCAAAGALNPTSPASIAVLETVAAKDAFIIELPRNVRGILAPE